MIAAPPPTAIPHKLANPVAEHPSDPSAQSRSNFRRILGVNFFTGDAAEAIGRLEQGGLVVVPAAPALKNLPDDREYREALLSADLVLTDSSFMVLLWNLLQGDSIRRLSGLKYLKALLQDPGFRKQHNTFWIMSSAKSAVTNVSWLRTQGIEVGNNDFYVAPTYRTRVEDSVLLAILARRRPGNVVVTIGGGTQERLGLYLKQTLNTMNYRPTIHCTGAAIAFLSGDQVHIPDWADELSLGWAFRCISSPRHYLKRYWEARKLAPLIYRNRDRLPVTPATWLDRLDAGRPEVRAIEASPATTEGFLRVKSVPDPRPDICPNTIICPTTSVAPENVRPAVKGQ